MNVIEKLKKWGKEGNFAIWGILGSLMILIGLFIPQIGYSGRQGEAYSILNHFVSELGEMGVSHLAIVFNIGLLIGGVFYLVFMIGLGLYIENFVAKIAMTLGVLTSICASLVGVFPMNNLEPHYLVAMGFFFGALITLGVFTIAILLQKEAKMPKYFSIGGIIVVLVYAWFLYSLFSGNTSSLVNFENRPNIWTLPILEWAAILSVIGDLFLLALYINLKQ